MIFLTSPKRCYGVGYPSSGRAFEGDPPRIEVFYDYYEKEEGPPLAPRSCTQIARVRFLGRERSICRAESKNGLVELSSFATYAADEPDETIFTLVTRRQRLDRDLATFENVLRSAKTCTATWRDDKGGSFTTGSGAPCPGNARYF